MLRNNQISDISPLSRLINLEELDLEGNQISNIKPLVANTGLSKWDKVWLAGNPLSPTSTHIYIPHLRRRGA